MALPSLRPRSAAPSTTPQSSATPSTSSPTSAPRTAPSPASPQMPPARRMTVPEVVWQVSFVRPDERDARWRARVLEQVRPALEQHLAIHPTATEFTLPTLLGTIAVRCQSATPVPGAVLRLAFAPETAMLNPISAGPGSSSESPEMPALRLPEARIQALGARLVGLDEIHDDILWRWQCQWDGALSNVSDRVNGSLPPVLQAYLAETGSLLVFSGDPGTGKSALAQALGDRYCREQGVAGTLLWLTTEARGDGTVGNFGQRLRAAFHQLSALPAGELGVLLVDEGDALGMQRSEAHAHQEDRAGTATLLQCLDALAGQPRRAVILTTNLAETVDAAVRRRGLVFTFPRPDAEARRQLLLPWLPEVGETDLAQAVDCCEGMTPADVERTLSQTWLGALRQGAAVTPQQVCEQLRGATRTGRV